MTKKERQLTKRRFVRENGRNGNQEYKRNKERLSHKRCVTEYRMGGSKLWLQGLTTEGKNHCTCTKWPQWRQGESCHHSIHTALSLHESYKWGELSFFLRSTSCCTWLKKKHICKQSWQEINDSAFFIWLIFPDRTKTVNIVLHILLTGKNCKSPDSVAALGRPMPSLRVGN